MPGSLDPDALEVWMIGELADRMHDAVGDCNGVQALLKLPVIEP